MTRNAGGLVAAALVAGCTSFGSTAPAVVDGGVDAASSGDAGDAAASVYAVPCWDGRTCTQLDYCCDPQVTGMPTCMATCTAGSGSASYSCHDAEDCRARGVGGSCCGYRQDANMVTTVCRSKCAAGEEQLCDIRASDDECASTSKTCTRYAPDLNVGGFASCR